LIAGRGALGFATLVERRDDRQDRRLEIGIDPVGTGGDQRGGHIAFADGAGLAAQPRQVAPENLELRSVDDGREQLDRRAQPPRRDAELMQRLRLVALGGGLMQ
jgi:hypothetical protein